MIFSCFYFPFSPPFIAFFHQEVKEYGVAKEEGEEFDDGIFY